MLGDSPSLGSGSRRQVPFPAGWSARYASCASSALRLAATGPEILTAKALGGLIYGLVGTAIIVGIIRPELPRPALFAVATLLLVLSMVGFGMVLGLVTRNANAINSFGAFLVFPLVGIAMAVVFVTSGIFATVL